jgi:hypothetical protein
MKDLATIFDHALDHRANNQHYEAGALLGQTAKKLMIDLDDLLDLFVDYKTANGL